MSASSRVCACVLALFTALGASVGTAAAQGTTAVVSGVVRDQTGAVLPGVSVTARNVATGIARTEVSDSEGRYRILNLAVGPYEVRAELSGFQASVRRGIELTVGREALVDFALAVGDLTEELVVTGEAPLVETRSGALSGVVTEERIAELPLNGRDLTQLVTLEPAVSLVRTGGSGAVAGFGARISISGARPDMIGWLLDGMDIQSSFKSGPAAAAGVQLGVEAVQEFRILTNSYSAEYASVGGGTVSSVTKSGTNALHGSIFEFHRSDALDARNFFDQRANPPPFTRNQFGFSLGGPIVKNRAFFFGTFEGLRERLTTTGFANVPTADARRGILPGTAPIQVHPAVVPVLNLLPMPNGRDLGNGTAEYVSESDNPTDEDYASVRLDYTINGNHSVYGRYTFDDAEKNNQDNIGLLGTPSKSRHQWAQLEGTNILSRHWLTKTRLAYNRSVDGDFMEVLRDIGPLLVTPFPFPANFQVPTLAGIGLSVTVPRSFILNQYELSHDVSHSAGAHNLKFGALVKHQRLYLNQESRAGGQFIFNSFADFLRGVSRSFQAPLPGGDVVRNFRQNVIGMYAQDNWQLTPRLTANLGLRYEFITEPKEIDDKSGAVRDVMDRAATVGSLYKNPSLKNLAPRVSLAWDVHGDGRTSVRGGFGLFYDQLTTRSWTDQSVRQPPFFVRGELRNPPIENTFDALLRGGGTPPIDLTSMAYDIDTPKILQFNLNMQRQVSSTLMAQVGFSGSRGWDLLRAGEANAAVPVIQPDGRKFFPAGSLPRNPVWASDRRTVSDAHSWYNALLLGVTKRFADGLHFQVSYTWAKTMDEASSLFSAALTGGHLSIDFYDASRNRGLSQYDLRHNLVVNTLWEVAWKRDAGGLTGVMLGGWQLGGIVTMQSGLPKTPTLGFNNSRNQSTRNLFEVPDLKPGASNNPVLGGPDRYFDASVYALPAAGYFGDVGRNTIIGPGVVMVDLALMKNFPLGLLGSGGRVQFRAEAFNVLNRANFGAPLVDPVLLNDGTPNPAAGVIRSTSTTSRQVQLGLKLIW